MKVNSVNNNSSVNKTVAQPTIAQKTTVASVLKIAAPMLEFVAKFFSLTNPSAAAVAANSFKG